MKKFINNNTGRALSIIAAAVLILTGFIGNAQDSSAVAPEAPKKAKPVKNTFNSVWIIDNQTVMVPIKGTFEMDIMHRFGVVDKGYEDLWGIYAPSNIRLGFHYTPIKNFNVGFGLTKSNMMWDVSAKYALLTQTKGLSPVSVTYYVNGAYDTRDEFTLYDGSEQKHKSDRAFYFHQLIIARKLTSRISIQVAPSLTHQNAVSGYYTKNDSTGQEIFRSMKNNHFAIAVSGRIKLSDAASVILNYDQPLTKHPSYNPNPNIGFGFEFNTSSHTFQIFMSNYSSLNMQRNNLFNTNSPLKYTDAVTGEKIKGGQFLIGFNVTRLWNY